MKDWYFRRQLKSSNVCVGLYTTRISDFVIYRRRCRFPKSLLCMQEGGAAAENSLCMQDRVGAHDIITYAYAVGQD